MKATKIKYEKTFNLGNYSNEVIGVEIELADGETAKDAIEKAREYVNKLQYDNSQKDKWRGIIEYTDNHLYSDVKEAEQKLKAAEMSTDDLPF